MPIKSLIRLARPAQWIKNVFVFGPVFFGGAMLNPHMLCSACIVFVAFCLASSSIYCLNDIIDVADDRRHPDKKKRPIASGAVSVVQAYGLMMLLLVLSAACVAPLAWLCGGGAPTNTPVAGSITPVLAVVLSYWLLNLAYCLKLKQYAIIDVCIVAFGFVLRLLAGGLATGIVLSKWIVLMTFLLTLFMGFAKRLDDVLRMEATDRPPRKNTIHYNLTFINQSIAITAGAALVCYIMYTMSAEVTARFGNTRLYFTSIFVLIGLLRYIQLAVVEKRSGDPTDIMLNDPFLRLVVVGWLIAFLLIVYIV